MNWLFVLVFVFCILVSLYGGSTPWMLAMTHLARSVYVNVITLLL